MTVENATPPSGDTTPTQGAGSGKGGSLIDGAKVEDTAAGTTTATQATGAGKGGSLVDGVKTEDTTATATKTDPNDPNAWVLSEGVLGTGDRPAWFKHDKYKSVSDQAAAYPELEKKLGSFTGAPKDGKYEFKPPEGVGDYKLEEGHPLTEGFNKWAVEHQLNQEGYNDLLGMLVQYELAQQPDMGEIKKELGEKADERIGSVVKWSKANLGDKGIDLVRSATTGANAAAVFQLIEQVIAKTTQTRLPKPGESGESGAQPNTAAAIREAQAKKGGDGKRLYDTDPVYRKQIEQQWADHYTALERQAKA